MKERLVGAAVLVAIGAWLIPWVLDGPEHVATSESTALELPAPTAENPPTRTETIVLDRRDSPVAREPVRATDPATNEQPAPSEPAAATPPRPAAPPPMPAPTTPEPTAAAQPSASSPSPAPAVADGGATAADGTQWYVQLGAFTDRDNAERLATRVGTYGHRAHVSEFPSAGRTVYRVRVGPEPSRERAESIASALSAHSFVAQVVFE